MSLIEANPAETDPKPAKPARVPKRIAQFVELLISGECRTQKAACDKLKLDPSYASKQLRKVHVATYLEQQTRVALARSQAPAAATLFRLLDQAASEHVQKDVAIHLLNIAGHKPKADAQLSVNIELKAGYVLDLRDEPRQPPVIDVTQD
jgi:hypothetical protein